MYEKHDAYLLYEYMKKVSFTVRILVRMKEKVDAKLLKDAAQKAISRLPYFAVKIRVDEGSNFVLEHNDAPIPVLPEKEERLMLGSEAVSGHLFAITYKDNCVWFNFAHTVCGGTGGMIWLKSTMYQYLTTKYGEIPAPKDIKLPGTQVTEGETYYPDPAKLPDDEPLKRYTGGATKVGLGRFLKFLLNPFAKKQYYSEISIPTDRFMEYAKSIDGSPNTIFASLIFKSLAEYFPEKKGNVISGRIADDFRKDIGAEESYRDFTRLLHIQYDRSMLNESMEKLNIRARGAIIYQMQPELSIERFRKIEETRREIDALPGLKSKKKYAAQHSLFRSDPRDVFSVSYVGQIDWGGMADHITEVYTLTDGDFMMEVNALPDKFCVSYQLVNKDRGPVDLLCKTFDAEGIPYEVSDMKVRYLPDIQIPKK